MQQRERRAALAGAVVALLATACDRATMPVATPEHPTSDAAVASASVISQSNWGLAGNEVTNGTAVAGDGSSYLVGSAFGPERARLFVLGFRPDGALSWQRTWTGTSQFGGDAANDVATATDGSVYVVGATPSNGGDALILKFSGDGTLQWQKTWGTSTHELANAVAVASDGTVYVTGSARNPGTGADDLFVMGIAPDGTLLWQRSWGGADSGEQGQGVAVGPDGSVYVAGVASRGGDPFLGEFDVALLKLDPAGGLLWQRAFAAGDVVDARAGVGVAADGSVYVAGGFQGELGGRFANNVLALKVAADGALVWARRWGGDGGDLPEDMAVAPDGSIALVGASSSYGQGGDAFLLRLGPGGRTVDAQTWGGAGSEQAGGVGVAPDGTISMGASAESPPYALVAAPTRTAKLRVSASAPVYPLVEAAGLVSDASGAVDTPAGSTTYAGGLDAVLVRIAP